MPVFDVDQGARLVRSMYRPQQSTLRQCLADWMEMEPAAQHAAYLVIEGGEPGRRHTFKGSRIAEVAMQVAYGS
ncbi:MAG: hypothetical protein EOO77_35490 [Oxalobacteraceae bacterium]|nr:MAG: hypothetical protein EOO77_35490 [Oxalobacteraceae bacterium]